MLTINLLSLAFHSTHSPQVLNDIVLYEVSKIPCVNQISFFFFIFQYIQRNLLYYIFWQGSCATFPHYLFQNAIILVNITSQKGQHPNLSFSWGHLV